MCSDQHPQFCTCDLMLNHFLIPEHSNPNSDICHRRQEQKLKKRTCNCITMQYFNLLHLGDGTTSNTFTQASTFWHLSPASCVGPREQRSRCLLKTSQCFPDSRMCPRGPQLLCLMEPSPGRNRHCVHQDLITGFTAHIHGVTWRLGPRLCCHLFWFVLFSYMSKKDLMHAFRKSEHIIQNDLIRFNVLFTKACTKPEWTQHFPGQSAIQIDSDHLHKCSRSQFSSWNTETQMSLTVLSAQIIASELSCSCILCPKHG